MFPFWEEIMAEEKFYRFSNFEGEQEIKKFLVLSLESYIR